MAKTWKKATTTAIIHYECVYAVAQMNNRSATRNLIAQSLSFYKSQPRFITLYLIMAMTRWFCCILLNPYSNTCCWRCWCCCCYSFFNSMWMWHFSIQKPKKMEKKNKTTAKNRGCFVDVSYNNYNCVTHIINMCAVNSAILDHLLQVKWNNCLWKMKNKNHFVHETSAELHCHKLHTIYTVYINTWNDFNFR